MDQKVLSQPRSGEASFTAADRKARLKNIALHSGEGCFAAADQKVWALCFCPPNLRFITLLKLITVRMAKKKKKKKSKTVKRNGSNMNLGKKKISNSWVASQEALCLMSLARHSCISMLYSRGIRNAKVPSWC